MNKKITMTLMIVCSISLFANLLLVDNWINTSKQQTEIDHAFSQGLARIGGNIKQNTPDSYSLALEHAHTVSALSEYTSYYKNNNYVLSYPRVIVSELRRHVAFQNDINEVEKLDSLLTDLSKEPTNDQIASRIVELIQMQNDDLD